MANIRHEKCDSCGKVFLVEIGYQAGRSDEDDKKDKENEIARLKQTNNWCYNDGNCNSRERESKIKTQETFN